MALNNSLHFRSVTQAQNKLVVNLIDLVRILSKTQIKLQVGVMEFGTDANQDKPQQFFFFFF